MIKQGTKGEVIKETYKGNYKTQGKMEIITFIKADERFGEMKQQLIIQSEKVHLKCTGQVSFLQRLHLHKTTESLYRYPYGSMLMMTNTTMINRQVMSKNNSGRVEMVYHLSINNSEANLHHLVVTYMEEN